MIDETAGLQDKLQMPPRVGFFAQHLHSNQLHLSKRPQRQYITVQWVSHWKHNRQYIYIYSSYQVALFHHKIINYSTAANNSFQQNTLYKLDKKKQEHDTENCLVEKSQCRPKK